MGKWLRRQKVRSEAGKVVKPRFTVFEIEKEGEEPIGKLAEGASFQYAFQDKKGIWDLNEPKGKIKNVGWIRFPPKLLGLKERVKLKRMV